MDALWNAAATQREPPPKATVANISSCKLNTVSIYIWCDLRPISSLQVNRKQMRRLVHFRNSSERDWSQHRRVRLALFSHATRWQTVTRLTPWFPCSQSPFPHSFHLRTSVCTKPGYGGRAAGGRAGRLPSVMESLSQVHAFWGQGQPLTAHSPGAVDAEG